MKTISFIGAALLGGWITGGAALAQNTAGGSDQNQMQQPPQQQQQQLQQPQQQPQQQGQQQQGQAPTASASQLITASAKVQNVDLSKRDVTLKTDDGRLFTIEVPQNVTRLDNVKKGDRVDATFYQSVAVSLMKPGEAPIATKEQTMGAEQGGKLPGGMIGQQITTTAKITKLDPTAGELTIKSPDGNSNTIKVDDPQMRQQLGRLKVGDKIQTTYTEAMATQVTPKRQM